MNNIGLGRGYKAFVMTFFVVGDMFFCFVIWEDIRSLFLNPTVGNSFWLFLSVALFAATIHGQVSAVKEVKHG